jgi:hypothetical protein
MKRIQSVLVLLLLLSASPAFALPTLQLDISNGIYDTPTETIVATGNTFTLYALLNGGDLGDTYYISAAISPQVENSADLGSFTVNGATVTATGGMTYGTPPLSSEAAIAGDLQRHGVFPTYFTEFGFNFDPEDKAVAYNSQDNPGGLVDADTGDFYYAAFVIDTTNLLPGYAIHFDLYNSYFKKMRNNDGGSYNLDFAPFSHDAESSTAPVPEPASILLLSTGILGLVGASRKKIFKK